MQDYNAERRRRAAAGLCVNNPAHGPVVAGGRCRICWDRKKALDRERALSDGTLACQACRRPMKPDERRRACLVCERLCCRECHESPCSNHRRTTP